VTDSERVPPPVRQILSYFVRNPGAADSLEGIARWRLLEESIHRSVQETERALSWLVKEGYLLAIPQLHASRLFQLNAVKQVEAESLLHYPGETDCGKRD
jgi:hypothetical protein